MDESPLIKAHDHAREAAIATHALDTTVAVTEHALAAGEFATAARTTASTEALRTLRLLEQHHERMAQLLRYSMEHPVRPPQPPPLTPPSDTDEKVAARTGTIAEAATPTGTSSGTTTTTASVSGVVSRGEFSNTGPTRAEDASSVASRPPGSASASMTSAAAAAQQAGAGAMATMLGSVSGAGRRYAASRELSSSIATNLASARGIRSRHRGQPAAPSVSTEQAPGNLDGQLGRDGSRSHMQSVLQQSPDGKPSWVPPTVVEKSSTASAMALPTTAPTAAPADDGFARFYSRFGSIINRLSAPLAFAGLPLIAEEAGSTDDADAASAQTAGPTSTPHSARQQQQQQQQEHRRRGSRPGSVGLPAAGAEPELSKIYSKAALRAIGRDGHSAMDSFYVVPRTGHTASYANILSFDQKEQRRRMAASVASEEELLDRGDEDAFADAKETQRLARGGSKQDGQHLVEELYIENQSLKVMLDKLSKRLHAFEASAQQSHMALQESMRLMRPGSPMGGESVAAGAGLVDDGTARRAEELEKELSRALRQLEASEKERAHQEKTLQRYRERWEKLKADVKARKGNRAE